MACSPMSAGRVTGSSDCALVGTRVLGSASTLHLTLNPDVGQVEADPSELNLSAFETFYTERRQFFLDGQEVFSFPLAFHNWARSISTCGSVISGSWAEH
jgi:hypothetical protein